MCVSEAARRFAFTSGRQGLCDSGGRLVQRALGGKAQRASWSLEWAVFRTDSTVREQLPSTVVTRVHAHVPNSVFASRRVD